MNFRDKDLAPYSGEETFIFLSYSHQDAKSAEEIIRRMQREGFRIWYDEGLTPGAEWDEKIAKRIKACGYFFALLSENYLASTNCRNELKYACDNRRNCLLIYLDKVTLPDGLQLRLGTLRAVYRSKDQEATLREIMEAEGIEACREDVHPDPDPDPVSSSFPAWKKTAFAVAAIMLIVLIVYLLSIKLHPSFRPSSSPSPSSALSSPVVVNQLPTTEPPPAPILSLERRPSKQDLDELETNIVYPNEDCYLDHYVYAEVAAPGGHSVNSYVGPDRSGTVVYIKNGEKVTVLAEQKDFSCVIIESEQKARWVTTAYLEPIEGEKEE